MNPAPVPMAERRTRVCLLGASLLADNRGVEALAAGTMAAALHLDPKAEIFLLDYSRDEATYRFQQGGAETSVRLLNIRFSKKFYLRNNIAMLLAAAFCLRLVPGSLQERILARFPILAELRRMDIIASIAGGDSFSDIYGMARFFYVSLPQILILVLGKPLILLPQTIGPFKGWLARRMAGFIMNRAQRVYGRDEESLRDAEALTSRRGHLHFSHDMAFAMEPLKPKQTFPSILAGNNSGRPKVGLNVSGLLFMGGYTGRNMFGLQGDYPELVRGLIRYFLKQGAEVVLIPHVFGLDEESDTSVASRVFKEMLGESSGRLHLVEGDFHAQEIKWIIGQCDFFAGSRMHACIAALSQGIPAVGLAYSKKFRGVFGSIGVEDLVVDLSRQNAGGIIDQVGHAYAAKGELQARLRANISDVKQRVLSLFSQQSSNINCTITKDKPQSSPQKQSMPEVSAEMSK